MLSFLNTGFLMFSRYGNIGLKWDDKTFCSNQYLKRHVMEEPNGEQSHGYLWEQSTELNYAWAD